MTLVYSSVINLYRGGNSSWRTFVKNKILAVLLGTLVAILIFAEPAIARKRQVHRVPPPPPIVVANIDVSSQLMTVKVNGWPTGYWKVSTAREGYHTPRGAYPVTRTAAVYFSKKYDNSPMPNSVFFYGGYAVHGTYHIGGLGRPASHGCVRVAPANAAKFYALVKEYGAARTRITIED
jgi:lipoprotein-anchoring transpeptidase ErfK/SrfK